MFSYAEDLFTDLFIDDTSEKPTENHSSSGEASEDYDTYFGPADDFWQNRCSLSRITRILHESYADYYSEGSLDHEKLKQGIVAGDSKAQELFKNIFHIKDRLKPRQMTTLINQGKLLHIQNKYGSEIFAHGVEEAKGGMENLLLIGISDKVNTVNWGVLQDGHPNMSPVPHGPYYIIYSTTGVEHKQVPINPTLKEIEYILVPFEKNKDILSAKLEEIMNLGLIEDDQKNLFLSKTISYENLLQLLNQRSEMENSKQPDPAEKVKKVEKIETGPSSVVLSVSTKHSFFKKPRSNEDEFDERPQKKIKTASIKIVFI